MAPETPGSIPTILSILTTLIVVLPEHHADPPGCKDHRTGAQEEHPQRHWDGAAHPAIHHQSAHHTSVPSTIASTAPSSARRSSLVGMVLADPEHDVVRELAVRLQLPHRRRQPRVARHESGA